MKRIEDLWKEAGVKNPVSLQRGACAPVRPGKKHRVNVLALGDVGRTVLLGLKLLGGDVISSIGICDLSAENLQRLEMEMNQISYPFEEAGSMCLFSVQAKVCRRWEVKAMCAWHSLKQIGN